MISFSDFSSVWRNSRFYSGLVSDRSLKWYYQQVLKLTFILDFDFSREQLVLWDADTIPIRPIRFFRGRFPLQYGSPYEFEDIYRTVNLNMFGERLDASCSKYSYVTQFCAVTQPMQELLELLIKTRSIYNPSSSLTENLSHILIEGVYTTGSSLNTPSFSEYELLGAISESIYKGRQIKLRFFRWEIQGLLNNLQTLILFILGYVHITYENIQDQKQRHMTSIQFLVGLYINWRRSIR